MRPNCIPKHAQLINANETTNKKKIESAVGSGLGNLSSPTQCQLRKHMLFTDTKKLVMH